MSLKNLTRSTRGSSGFTIVELLIVIVVIAILAAITIVAYNGITARANTSSAQAAASSVIKKIEAYNAEETGYPTSFGALTASAAQSKSYGVSGVTFRTAALTAPSSTEGPATVSVYRCPSTGTITGMVVQYWKYDASPAAANTLATGPGAPTAANSVTGCSVLAS